MPETRSDQLAAVRAKRQQKLAAVVMPAECRADIGAVNSHQLTDEQRMAMLYKPTTLVMVWPEDELALVRAILNG